MLWEEDLWRLCALPDGRLRMDLRDETGGRQLAADMAADGSEGRLFLQQQPNQAKPPFVLTHPVDHVVLMTLLAHAGGAMLHASAVAIDDEAWVFCGRSGAGKTTIARAWREAGAVLLNDDRVMLRMIAGQPFAAAAPWHGVERTVTPGLWRLRGLAFLKQAPVDRLSRLPASEAATRLSAATFLPLFLADGVPFVLNTWNRLLAAVPAYELAFTPGASSMELCREVQSTGL